MKTTREQVLGLLKAHRGIWLGGRVELGGLYHKMSSRVSELNADGAGIEKRTRRGKRYKEYRMPTLGLTRPLDLLDTLSEGGV